MPLLSKFLQPLLRLFGLGVLPHRQLAELLFKERIPYLTKRQAGILDFCTPFTQTTRENAFALIRATEYISSRSIPGGLVECGVWKGGSSMIMARVLDALKDPRDLYLFDTFRGMPSGCHEDIDLDGNDERWYREKSDEFLHFGSGAQWNAVSLEQVKKNLGLLPNTQQRLHFVEGRVEDTIPGQAPERIALLRLDTDFYESTKHELEHLYPRLSPGGVVIIDDYGHFLGARKAVDNYFGRNEINILLNRVDYTSVLGVKA